MKSTADEIRELGKKARGFGLWGVAAEDMDREQLLGFIVFLDEAFMDLRSAIGPEGVLRQTYKALYAKYNGRHPDGL